MSTSVVLLYLAPLADYDVLYREKTEAWLLHERQKTLRFNVLLAEGVREIRFE